MTSRLNDPAETNQEKREHKEENATNTNDTNVPAKSENTEHEPYMLPKDPLEYDGQWVCNHCNGEVDGFTVYSLVRGLQAEVEAIKGVLMQLIIKQIIVYNNRITSLFIRFYNLEMNPDVIEAKLASFSKTLHSNHFVLLTLKRRLLDLYRVLGEQDELEPVALRSRLERQVSVV